MEGCSKLRLSITQKELHMETFTLFEKFEYMLAIMSIAYAIPALVVALTELIHGLISSLIFIAKKEM